MSRFNTHPIYSRYRHRLVTATLSLLGTLCLTLPVSVHADGTAPCNLNSVNDSGLECGENSVATGQASTAVGNSTEATGFNAIALGASADATGGRSMALGVFADATATDSTAVGYSARATGLFATALGVSAEATAFNSTALGVGADATAENSTALGVSADATAFNSTALGAFSNATASNSTALGVDAQATGIASVALGGDGVDFELVSGAQALADYAIAIGSDARADKARAMAMGDRAQATGERATAIGFATTATNDGSVAVGSLSTVTGFRATAVGHNADAAGGSTVAVGRFSRAVGPRSTAVGNNAVASLVADDSTAIGTLSRAINARSTAIGFEARTVADDNIAIGNASANYTLAGLSHNGPGLFTVLVDSNGNLFAQDLNSGAGKISAESNTLPSKPDRTTGSAQYTSQSASNPLNTNATTVSNVQTDDSNRLDQLFALVEAQQQQIDALLTDRETLTQRITELEAATATATATSEPALLLNAATINQKSLQHMGFDQSTASVIVDEFDLTQTQALSLRHNATREGWLFSGRFRQAMVDMTDHFVNAIGIENYRQLMGANGETTNVVVDAVLPKTTAADNGIQANDVIVEYAGNAIYSSESLITASANGSTDDTVLVRLLRDDQPVELYIPAGPMGIRSGSTSDAPCVWCAGGI